MRQSTRTAVLLFTALSCWICSSRGAAAQTFTDGFEGPSISSFWTTNWPYGSSGPGTVTITTALAQSGIQSVQLATSPAYPWSIALIHDFGSKVSGSVSVYTQSGVLGSQAGFEIQDVNGNSIAVIQRIADGSFVGRFWPTGLPEITAIPISGPLSGWHKLEMAADSAGLTMKFDGVVVFMNSSVTGFRTVSLQAWGYPVTSQYFDTFNATIAPPTPLYSVCPLYDFARAVKSGGAIPIKLQLCTNDGGNLSSSAIPVHAIGVTQASTSISALFEDSGNANPDNDFRFDPTLGGTGGYIFNLSTKGLTTGTYNLNFKAGIDATTQSAPFQVK